MCGIAGIFVSDGPPPAEDDVARMNNALAHRGPDGAGIWLSADGRCRFGHRRLAILDLDQRSDQPMVSPDGRYAMIFNGEIFNFLELRADLETRGHQFRTESDTEVVLAAWREWGEDMLLRFNGMWALAIYDHEERTLFLARDRYGVKPLVYAVGSGGFAFASEPRALLALPWVNAALEPDVARRALFDPFGFEGSDRSLRRGVRKVPAGHSMRIGPDGRQRVRRWWVSADHLETPPATLDAAAVAFRERFETAVRVRMRSDVRIGSCLSGGFDSSSIVAAMQRIAGNDATSHTRESGDWRHAFIASFPGMLNDETQDALTAATYAGIDRPVVLDLSRDDPLEHIDAVLDTVEDPFISLPTAVWKIYRAVGDHGVRVSLDGHGADELMGGYRAGGQSLMFFLSNIFGNVAAGRSAAVGRVNDGLKKIALRRQGNYFIRGALPPARIAMPADNDQLPKSWGLFNRRLYGMFHSTILPTLLRNFDRLSMSHSVEVRSPYLDWRLVQLVLSLPDEMKSNQEYSKLVARTALRGAMPESIRSATRKVGFGSQMPEWLNGTLGQWSERLLATSNDVFDELVDRPALVRRVAELNARRAWDWPLSVRLFPYLHFKWLADRTN